jgi:hypothetical protein
MRAAKKQRRAARRLLKLKVAALLLSLCAKAVGQTRLGYRGNLRRRQRMNWEVRVALLSTREFHQRYRMDRNTFHSVAEKIRADVEPNAKASANASGGNIPLTAEVMLSATIRFLAGGAYQDIVDMHGIAESTFRGVVRTVSFLLQRCCLTSLMYRLEMLFRSTSLSSLTWTTWK